MGCDPSLVGWSLALQLSSFQNQVRPGCAVLVEFLRDKYPLCNNESDASTRARFVCKLLISRHCYNSRTSYNHCSAVSGEIAAPLECGD